MSFCTLQTVLSVILPSYHNIKEFLVSHQYVGHYIICISCSFILPVVYQGLVRSCSYPVVIDVVSNYGNHYRCKSIFTVQGDGSATVSMETPTRGSDAYSDNTDAVTGKPVSYKDFVGLWSHLLNPSRIKVFMFL